MDKNEIVNSLIIFKNRRDDLLHEDNASFEHHLDRFVEFCLKDPIVNKILQPISTKYETDIDLWMKETNDGDGKIKFPDDPEEEFDLRFRILENAANDFKYVFQLGLALGGEKRDGWIHVFRSVIIRPFVDEVSNRLGDIADLASPDARVLQAVPLNRIPSTKHIKIFLSHKSTDKQLVYRYHNTLKELGYNPWLDEPAMVSGSNLAREILKGFQESCAAIFFLTADFKDEKYLAAEIDYAVMQKRQKGKKFSIVTLRNSDAAPVPDLLTPYIYKIVNNDLEGFFEIIKALPIELGPVRWKESAVD